MLGSGIALGLVMMVQGQMQAAPLVVGHRGASREAPENTLPAFRLAWEQGADAIEGDFHLTRDGQVVCIHDPDTERVAGTRLVVGDATLEALRRLDVGRWHDPRWAGTTIPTLSEVLDTVPPGKKIYLELKSGTAIIPPLLAGIAAAGLAEEQVRVIAFNAETIAAVKRAAPGLKAFWLASLKRDPEGVLTPSPDTVLATLRRIGADGFSAGQRNLEASLVRSVREAGFEFHVWTVDDPALARTLLQWGAMSITSNLPGWIKGQLFAPL
jgi:glycerophosphoryl diester phosphodiesterase